MKKIKVNIADIKTTSAPNILVSTILGSRLVITMHDAHRNTGGLAHAAFPQALDHLQGIYNDDLMYTNNAITALVEEMVKSGSLRHNINAKIIHGPESLPNDVVTIEDTIVLVREQLQEQGIQVIGECHGSLVEFCTKTGIVTVRTKL